MCAAVFKTPLHSGEGERLVCLAPARRGDACTGYVAAALANAMGDEEDEAALQAARAKAASRIAAAQKGRKARIAKREQDQAATKLQAIHRGRVARRRRFVLAEATHSAARPGHRDAAEAVLAAQTKPLTMKQLGLPRGLPKNPVPELHFLTFNSWYNEMGTKRYMEICFDLETELFQVILDKHVTVLDPKHVNAPLFDSLKKVTSKEIGRAHV